MAATMVLEGAPSILLVEDHPLMATSVRRCLESELDCAVDWHNSAERGWASYDPERHAAAIVDLSLPGKPGLWLIRQLHAREPQLPICAFSSVVSDPDTVLQAGASGYLSKLVGDDFSERIASLLRGETVFDSAISNEIMRTRTAPRVARNRLGARELSVLEMMASGASVEQMASKLMISPNSVKDVQKRMYPKLGVNGKGAAVAAGFRLGLLS